MIESLTFCGRTFRCSELELMRQIAREFSGLGVTEIARTICELLEWTRPGGGLKNHECRQLLRARDLIRQVCQARDVVIIRGAVSPDHIHMLVSAPPQLAPAKLVQYVKGRSSRRLQDEFPELRKRYWGQHLWARGYFCATVGTVDEQMVKAYIENQKWDEDDQGFKITAPTEP